MLSESANAEASSVSSERMEADAPVSWLEGRDILAATLVMILWLMSLCLPQKYWRRMAFGLAHLRLACSAKLSEDELETIKAVVGPGEGKAAWIEESFRQNWLGHKFLSWMMILACYRPWRWQPRPKLIGRQHLDAALVHGRGAILLNANFVYKDLMAKAALSSAGFQASHLLRDTHGFAGSRLGKTLLNPIYTGIERRFLRERLVFSGSQTGEINQLIRSRLRGNHPILVTVTPLGRRTSTLPFLHGRIKIATGALNFACEAGAEVLPVFTIQKPNGDFETIIEHPLTRPSKAAHSEAIKAMLDDYLPRLETYVAQYPDQFGFPTSNHQGEAMIEPWPDSAQPQPPEEDRSRQPLPKLT